MENASELTEKTYNFLSLAEKQLNITRHKTIIKLFIKRKTAESLDAIVKRWAVVACARYEQVLRFFFFFLFFLNMY